MPYLPLKLPPGMFLNSTPYGRMGRWTHGNLVRWYNNLIKPIGGWRRSTTDGGTEIGQVVNPPDEISRDMYVWRDNDNDKFIVVGSNKGAKSVSVSTGTITDISPSDFPDNIEAGGSDNTGYGGWFYGLDAYGTERASDDTQETIFRWSFDNWGENLLATTNLPDNALYEWDPDVGGAMQVVANAPTGFDTFLVTSQRIVMTVGSNSEARLVQWSDSENNTEWTPAVNNQAGSQPLAGIGRFYASVQVRDVVLLVSETDAHIARYVGPPYIYSFDKVGDNCGIKHGHVVIATDDYAIWPGRNSFFIFDGSVVKPLDCDVADFVGNAFNSAQAGKATGFVNSTWSEFWWLYQASGAASDYKDPVNSDIISEYTNVISPNNQTNETDSYVFYNWRLNCWGVGKLDRSAAHGDPSLGGPYMVSPTDGYLYEHELDGVIPGETESDVYLSSGPIEVNKGEQTQYMDYLRPDFIDSGEVDVVLVGQDRPQAHRVAFGPYPVGYTTSGDDAQPISIRARGHIIYTNIIGKTGRWALGQMSLNVLKAVSGRGRVTK